MPSYYSLVLEHYADRRTRVLDDLCDAAQSPSLSRPLCPEWLVDGVDKISYRSLNDICPANPSRVRLPQ